MGLRENRQEQCEPRRQQDERDEYPQPTFEENVVELEPALVPCPDHEKRQRERPRGDLDEPPGLQHARRLQCEHDEEQHQQREQHDVRAAGASLARVTRTAGANDDGHAE
jgi:hypothetical protein